MLIRFREKTQNYSLRLTDLSFLSKKKKKRNFRSCNIESK